VQPNTDTEEKPSAAADKPARIIAKFNGQCRSCNGWIKAGDQCHWSRSTGATHIACPEQNEQKSVTVQMGVFRKNGRIYVVKPNKEKTRVYAKEIIESPPRITEAGAVVDFESVYRAGAVYDLSESDRWQLADAREFLTKYARCIVCGAHLKSAKSVAGAIGPVCARYFAGAKEAA
jgi:NADH pyrophosphatase NudC (nudix superfamily)